MIAQTDVSASAGITRAVAQCVLADSYDDLPASTIAATKLAVLDLLGIAVRARSAEPSSAAILSAVERLDSGSSATVVGSPRGFSVQYSALLNGALAHTLDFDDTHARATIHPGAVVIPAVLAAAEDVDAPDSVVVRSIVAGYDVAARLSEAADPRAQYERGFHPTCTAGVFR